LNMKKIVIMAMVSVFMLSAVLGGRAQGSHDVAVTEVGLYHLYRAVGLVKPLIKPEAYPRWTDPIDINVTVKNEGDYSESFNVTAYCNETAIGMKNVTLAPGENKTLTFTWRPYLPGYRSNRSEAWPYPVYIVSANASVVPGEVYTDNNVFIDGTVKVMWPGDGNGDGHVNVLDLGHLGVYWLSSCLCPWYTPLTDFNADGKINVIDLGILGVNWHSGPLD